MIKLSLAKLQQQIKQKRDMRNFNDNLFLYILVFPALAFTFVFAYIPLTGLITAFKDYDIWKGFWGSPWAGSFGFAHIMEIFQLKPIYDSILNTIMISVMNLVLGFPLPIILALLFNELKVGIYKKTVQTISYMPFFLSWIAVIGLTVSFFDSYGPVNDILSLIFGESRERVLYLAEQKNFVPMLLGLNVWKSVGWGSIIYLASIASIDPQLYEAAAIDGATRFQQIRFVTFPGIAPTAAIVLILSIGGILGSNFELVFGLQNAFIDFETIDTAIYKYGIVQRGYSMATAVGFTRGIIALGLTFVANSISRNISQTSVF
jgi:putative aldouronate transport system permease protein